MHATDDELAEVLLRRWGREADADLTTREVAGLIPRASVSTVNKWRAEGVGPPYRKAGFWVRYRAGDLALWVVRQWTPGEE